MLRIPVENWSDKELRDFLVSFKKENEELRVEATLEYLARANEKYRSVVSGNC